MLPGRHAALECFAIELRREVANLTGIHGRATVLLMTVGAELMTIEYRQ